MFHKTRQEQIPHLWEDLHQQLKIDTDANHFVVQTVSQNLLVKICSRDISLPLQHRNCLYKGHAIPGVVGGALGISKDFLSSYLSYIVYIMPFSPPTFVVESL